MEIVFYVVLSLIVVYYMLRLFNIKSAKVEKRGFFTPWFSKEDGVHSEKLDKFLTKNFKYLWLLSIVGIVCYVIIISTNGF